MRLLLQDVTSANGPTADGAHSYNDDEPSKAAPAAEPEPVAPTAAEPVAKVEEDYSYNTNNQSLDYDVGDDSHMNGAEEYEDDDDDVDFNLGNGGSHAPDTPTYSGNNVTAPSKGPNAKEDG